MKSIGFLCCLAFLATFTSGVEIQCNFDIMDWERGFRDMYLCSTTIISVENPTTVTEISGTHLEGRNNEDVKSFNVFNHKILTKIPKGIENFFPNLEVFLWLFGNISSIDSSTLKPFPNLRHFHLGDNKLVTLDSNLFQYTRKLQAISFGRNHLKHVGHDLLTGLTDLKVAVFESNPCINTRVDTPREIKHLNLQLRSKCPAIEFPTTPKPTPPTAISTTSEPNECPIRCTMNEEADEMKKRIEEIEKQLKKLI